MNTSMNTVDEALAASSPSTVLAAAWDALDLGVRVADAVTWDGTGDELQALTAAQACSAARSLLPLPDTGPPIPLEAGEIQDGPGGLAPYVSLLGRTHGALAALAGTDAQLGEAAEHAATAARALAAVRGQ
ncbi:hypothetical protein [Streptomyces sp. NBC_01012]|uniref:hypothetical protein n=1 Tax=Streptomyces sp. NBC_01012 TaxID=2903717 RepID=UPI002F90B541|nr:hypothetical protein OG623_34945 [Streptomyces sp. NBC_01012]